MSPSEPCSRCGAPPPESSDARFCPACGASLDAAAGSGPDEMAVTLDAATTPPAARTAPTSSSTPWRSGSSTPGAGRFAPGEIFAGRYRIVGLLGKGGMGEVYRADDLTLDQAVALKFLPEEVARERERLDRFLGEVRIARQISHPNVCRVYDIGEYGGTWYLSMEYVDGEDLSTLIRRIGRIPRDKAIDIARKLCAGLAASHEKGILHRDLKPANIMLDGEGNVRITDFGLAALASDVSGGEVRAGTPAYMAPEQLSGTEVTVRSDLYSLGLVLYEILTGRATWKASSVAELSRFHAERSPDRPTTIVEGLDADVERIILACLERDPEDRPDSALAVAAALPGGDPLAAALAAGEIPSPEIVAAWGKRSGLSAVTAWTLVAASAVLALLAAVVLEQTRLEHRVPLTKTPEVFADRAEEILAELGHELTATDEVHGIYRRGDALRQVMRESDDPQRWDRLPELLDPPVSFWYRQSPRQMVGRDVSATIGWDDPDLTVTGMARLQLTPSGNLLSLTVVPPEREDSVGTPHASPDWGQILALTGLDAYPMEEVTSTWVPEVYSDDRRAWRVVPGTGTHEDTLRVEAGAYRGTVNNLRIIGPSTFPYRMVASNPIQNRFAAYLGFGLFLFILGGALVLARFNLRRGAGDRRGANRLAAFVVLVSLLRWITSSDHVPTIDGFMRLFWPPMGIALINAAIFYGLYVALEPFVRRYWPGRMVSWSRLLAGKVRDPLVGRDVLIGVFAGLGIGVLDHLRFLIPEWAGVATRAPIMASGSMLRGPLHTSGDLAMSAMFSVSSAMALTLILLAVRVVIQKLSRGRVSGPRADAVAVGLATVVAGLFATIGEGAVPWVDGPLMAAVIFFRYVVLLRFGVVSVVVLGLVHNMTVSLPVSLDAGTWYAGSTLVGAAVLVAMLVYGARVATAGSMRPAPVGGTPAGAIPPG